MALSKNMERVLNKQINAEIFSAYLYKSMAAYFESVNLSGFAHWMSLQAQEELAHSDKFFVYVGERFGKVVLTAIDAPKTEWQSPLDVFKDAFAHEKKVTKLIYNLVDVARQEKGFATENFLQWFVTEQVEEESSADAIVNKLEMVGNDKKGLYLLDQELGQRVAQKNVK